MMRAVLTKLREAVRFVGGLLADDVMATLILAALIVF